MTEYVAQGLPASWLNGWLAAIGVTVLCPDVKLSWTDSLSPRAIFHFDDSIDLPERIASKWPTIEKVGEFAISRRAPGEATTQKLSTASYVVAAEMARGSVADFSLSAFITDLERNKQSDETVTSNFYPGAEGAMPMHKRLTDCLKEIGQQKASLQELFVASFNGHGEQSSTMGLGFNYRRIGAFVSPTLSAKSSSTGTTDPILEVLAFYGVTRFPCRGDGLHFSQKGWTSGPRTKRIFEWGTWGDPLDLWAIDALCDLEPATAFRLRYRSVAYDPGSNSKLRGYGSKRVL